MGQVLVLAVMALPPSDWTKKASMGQCRRMLDTGDVLRRGREPRAEGSWVAVSLESIANKTGESEGVFLLPGTPPVYHPALISPEELLGWCCLGLEVCTAMQGVKWRLLGERTAKEGFLHVLGYLHVSEVASQALVKFAPNRVGGLGASHDASEMSRSDSK